jgi:hypothetical protein
LHGSDRQLKPLHGIVLSARRESIAARLPAVTSTPSTCSIITKAPSARNRATNSHLHMFRIAGREYGPACSGDELGTLDEKQFRIGQRPFGGRDPVQPGKVRIREPRPHIRRGQHQRERVSQRDLPLRNLAGSRAVTPAVR